MPDGCVGHTGFNIQRCREWRVHDDATRHHSCIEPVVDLCGVVRRHVRACKQAAKQGRTHVGNLVHGQSASGKFSLYRQQSRARRGLEHQFAQEEARSKPRHPCQSQRGRELLVGLHFLAAPGLRRCEPGNPFDKCQPFERISGPRMDRRAVAAHEQQLRDLDGFVGGLPAPGASRITCDKGGLHGGANGGRVDPATGGKVAEQVMGCGDDRGSGLLRASSGKRARGGTRQRRVGHVGIPCLKLGRWWPDQAGGI